MHNATFSFSFVLTDVFSVGQLANRATINAWIQPVSLPHPDSPPLADGAPCTVSGWGVTWLNSYKLSPVLRAVDVEILQDCGYYSYHYYYYIRVTNNMICAGSRSGGKDSCLVRHKLMS